MRPDMAKIIVERPRRRSWFGKVDHPKRVMRHAAKRDPEHAIAIRGMRRLAHSSRGKHLKSLNENLAPLERFLDRAVGRPWNEVYSEISQHIRLSSAVQFHILQHIGDFVEVRPGPGRRWWRPRLWVDSTDGMLKRRELRNISIDRGGCVATSALAGTRGALRLTAARNDPS
jgi:hypothetical protein